MAPTTPTDWHPIDTLPDNRKDGRAVLLWADGSPFLANYMDHGPAAAGWFTIDWFLDDITHWADVTPPAGAVARRIAEDFEAEPGENEWSQAR